MVKSGIYFIINLIDGKYYVGSAKNFNDRFATHICQLNNNYHPNAYLQHAWDRYGEDNFQFTIVEEIEDLSKLIEIEQKWINSSNCCNHEFGYNLSPTAGNSLGRKHTSETISKFLLVRKGMNRKLDKWPCEFGSRCRCDKCNNKKNEINNVYATKKREFINPLNILANRKPGKWPHLDGCKCKCDDCKTKKRSLYYNKKLKSSEEVTYFFVHS